MWLTVLLLAVTSLIICDYLFRRHRNRLIKAAGILGPKLSLPFLGDALSLFGDDTETIFHKLESLALEYGKTYRLWLGPRLFLFISDPKFFREILKSPVLIKKSFFYEMFSRALDDGLLLSFGSKWHARRKVITPTFHFKILDEFVEVFDRQSAVLVKQLYERADGKTVFDIYPKLCLMALDIIVETAMGVKINAQENPNVPYVNALTDALHIMATRLIKPIQHSTLGFMLSALPSYLKLNKSVKIMHNFTDKVINDRKASLKDSYESKNNTINDIGQKKRMAFLDVLLLAEIDGKPLNYQEIREEVDTFMFEGHDSTSSAISFCLYLLARHADIQQKLFQEIFEVIGPDKNKPVAMRDLQELKYMELVIKESLRVYPSLPFIGRQTEQDIHVDDKLIPANTNLILLIHNAAHDPDTFEKPNEFIPERYYSEQLDSINSFASIPFSAGPRNCIGQKFALLEMKSTISKMLRHFELLPFGPDVVPVLSLVLRSKTGIHLGLKPRKY